MTDQSSPARRIKDRYDVRVRAGFPTADIKKLIPDDAEAMSLLHGRIDLYLSGIAGYASSADRLGRRPEQDLRTARLFLSKTFFDKYQEYAPFKGRITSDETPALFREMEAAELNRIDLLEEVERLLTLK
jgi:hypothetical protein